MYNVYKDAQIKPQRGEVIFGRKIVSQTNFSNELPQMSYQMSNLPCPYMTKNIFIIIQLPISSGQLLIGYLEVSLPAACFIVLPTFETNHILYQSMSVWVYEQDAPCGPDCNCYPRAQGLH